MYLGKGHMVPAVELWQTQFEQYIVLTGVPLKLTRLGVRL